MRQKDPPAVDYVDYRKAPLCYLDYMLSSAPVIPQHQIAA